AVVQEGSNHAELMTLACKTAVVERDVGHLVFPDEVQVRPSEAEAGRPEGRTGDRHIEPPADVLAQAAKRIAGAERPMIVAGAGARFDMDPITALASERS
ncbi:MAG: thiamine pyrophosphate-binding protein, partial [Gaiellales bacterium]